MDAIATRGHVILDDTQVRLRTSGTAQRFTELFALKADSSTVNTGLEERPTASQVTSEIAAAINALTGSAPALLNTLEEIANAINDDNDVYQTLLALINSKQTSLLIPSAVGINFLSGTNLRNLEVTGNGILTDNTNRVTLNITGVSSGDFTTYQSTVTSALASKQATLVSGSSVGHEILTGNTIKRIRFYGGNVSTTSDANEILVQMLGYSQAQVNTLLATKQATLASNSGTGEEILTGSTIRRIRATGDATVSLVDGNISIGVSAVSAADVAASIAAAVSAYTLTSALTPLLNAKQATLTSASGSGIALLDTTTIRRIDSTGDSILQLSESGGVITLTTDGRTKAEITTLLAGKQDSISNYSVTGSTLLDSGGLKRLNVTLDIALGVPLTLTENTTGQLTLASNSYSYGKVDTFLAAKQNALSVSSVTGSSLLSGTVLKRLDFDTGDFNVSDSGHALNVSITGKQDSLINSTGAGEGERIDLWNGSAGWVRCLEFFPSNVFSTLTGSDNINVTLDLSSYATTAAVNSAIATANTSKQDSLQFLSATGTPVIDPSTLNVLRITANAPLSVNMQEANRSMLLAVDCWSKSDGDSRYYQTASGVLEIQNPTASTRSLRLSSNHSSNSQIRFEGGALLFRRVNTTGFVTTQLQFPNNSSGNAVFTNTITANAFQNSSDRRLKDNEQECLIADVGAIVDQVSAKTYERNDRNQELRVGFIANDLQEACQGHYACILGEQPILDDEGVEVEGSTPILTVDYPRLTSILWTAVRDLRNRVQELENARL